MSKIKESRTTGVTAGIMGGCAADLITYEVDDDGTPVRRVIVQLTTADLPHLEAAVKVLRVEADYQERLCRSHH